MDNTDHLERFGDEGIGDGWGAGGDRQNGDDDYNDTKKREKKKEKIGDGWGAGGDRQNVPTTHVGLRRHGNDLSYGRGAKKKYWSNIMMTIIVMIQIRIILNPCLARGEFSFGQVFFQPDTRKIWQS